MIAVEHLSVQFGGRYLFRDASFTLGGRDRAGIVGANGAGKSTLLKIIYGLMQPESGVIQTPRDYILGYLPQEVAFDTATLERTALSEVMMARADVVGWMEALDVQQHLLATHPDHTSDEYMQILEKFGDLQHKIEGANAYSLESDASRILSGLGFSESDQHRPIKEFSGGWQMRIMLAKLLLQHPDALLLDEPTNHLDLASLLWLEEYLKVYDGVIAVVSHDRDFLNGLTNKTVYVAPGKYIEMFAGNYDYFEKTSAEREAQRAAYAATVAARRNEMERFVERFRYKATKARQAQSRIKMLERMERIELSEHEPFIHFDFPEARPSGRTVFEIKDGSKSYDDKLVFSHCDLRIERGERVAFLGRNGEGKTTLGKILAGVENLTSGENSPTHNVQLGYYAQHVADQLDPKATVYETIDTVVRSLYFNSDKKLNYNESQIRALLGSFLFRGDDVIKPVRVLSGGEKSRLALAKLLLIPSNTLVLDEPTNHLDMRSKEVLKQALLTFEGTIVVISHDRDFLRDLADRVITFGGGRVKEYFGALDQYISELDETERQEVLASKRSKENGKSKEPPQSNKDRKRDEAAERSERSKKLKPFKDKLSKIESAIAPLEAKQRRIEEAMFEPDYYKNAVKAQEDAAELKAIHSRLEGLYYEWTAASEELEKAGK
ncbi:MAG TPA: ABC-F family ATP-binding cassette domain-containing protein [Candidatus Kapabacteria bacterium]|nr:ABC-F family ATP-binding cassette domain-containing protein [Candidatus Kapabacteria bacterium]